MNKEKRILLNATIAGMLGATVALSATSTRAEEKAADGKCVSANDCKGKSACHTAKNDCSGKNSCKGLGWLMISEADCQKHIKKNKKVKFEKL